MADPQKPVVSDDPEEKLNQLRTQGTTTPVQQTAKPAPKPGEVQSDTATVIVPKEGESYQDTVKRAIARSKTPEGQADYARTATVKNMAPKAAEVLALTGGGALGYLGDALGIGSKAPVVKEVATGLYDEFGAPLMKEVAEEAPGVLSKIASYGPKAYQAAKTAVKAFPYLAGAGYGLNKLGIHPVDTAKTLGAGALSSIVDYFHPQPPPPTAQDTQSARLKHLQEEANK